MKKRKFALILLISVLMIVGLKLAYAFTFVDDSDTDFLKGNFTGDGNTSRVVGTGAGANVTINISRETANYTENLFGRGIEINASVILYMRFEEGTGQYANDSSIYQFNNGTLGANNAAASDDPVWNSSTKFENFGLRFDENTDHIAFATDTGLTGMSEITIAVWGKPGASGSRRMVSHGSVNDYVFLIDTNNALVLSLNAVSLTSPNDVVTSGTWHHFVATWDTTSDLARLYVNGVLVEKGTISITTVADTGSLVIGNTDNPSGDNQGFGGTLDEFAIWNISLTNETILDLYQKGWGYFNTSNFTSQTFNANSIANWTTISWAQEVPYQTEIGRADRDVADAAEDSGFINTTGLILLMHLNNETEEQDIPLGDRLIISNEKELILYMQFDSANAEEIKPNGSTVLLMHFNNDTGTGENASLFFNNATYANGTGLPNGTCILASNQCPIFNESNARLGNAGLEFDGFNDFINISNVSGLPEGAGSRTFEAWVYSKDCDTQNRDIIAQGKKTNNNRFAMVCVGGEIYFAGQANDINGVLDIPNNQWTHTAITYDGTNLNMYVNGVKDPESTTKTLDTLTSTVFIGANIQHNEFWNGTIDEAAIWNVSLSPEVIARHSGYGIDKSIYGNNATFMNGTVVNFTNSKFGEAMGFDGVDDFVSMGSKSSFIFTNTSATELWIHPKTLSGNDAIIAWYNDTAGSNSPSAHPTWYLFYDGTEIKIGGIADNTQASSGVGLNTNEWTYLALVTDNVSLILYKNGIRSYSKALTGDAIPTGDIGDMKLRLGFKANIEAFHGTIDEVAIWNKSLSADRIAEHAGIKVRDYSGFGNNGTRGDGDGSGTWPNYTISGKFGYALEFDGDDDWVNVTDSDDWDFASGEDFTIGLWVNFNSLEDSQQIINFGGDFHLEIEFGEPTGRLSFSIPNEANNAWVNGGTGTSASKTDWNTGQWYYITLKRSSGAWRFYVDGQSEAKYSLSDDAINSADLRIGWGFSTRYFNGIIDEVAIWNGSLSSNEIQNLYKRGVLRLNLSYRTSNDSVTFSGWKGVGNNNLSTIGEQARYLEYKAVFNTTDNAYTPILNNVTVVVDSTCPCPSSGDWVIQDGCIVDTTCSMDGSDVYIASGSNLTINAGGLSSFNNIFVYGNLFCRADACFG